MPVFAILWPWIGIGAAGILLLMLGLTDGLQADRTIPRWFDLPWLVWLGLAATLLHAFEAHGLDLSGMPYAWRGALCGMLGYRDPISCPVPLSFVTVANLGSVWAAGLLAALLCRRSHAIGLSLFAVPLVSACLQIGAAVMLGRYIPGLFTAVVLLLPVSLWTLSVAARAGLPASALIVVPVSGLVALVILIGALTADLRDVIGVWPLNIIAGLAICVPAALMAVVARTRPAPPPPQVRRRPNLRSVPSGATAPRRAPPQTGAGP